MMNISPVLSVIMPVYKSEEYLDVMLGSVVNQTFRDFELICVDDGSPDQSARMLDDAAADDERVIVIHRKNGGVLTARPTVFPLCRGEYVGFADSDDCVHPQMYEIMVDAMTEQDADISWCLAELLPDSQPLPTPAPIERTKVVTEILTVETACAYLFSPPCPEIVPNNIWNRIFRADLLRDCWPPYSETEDFEIVYRTVNRARRILLIREPLYIYVQRQCSLMHTRFSQYRYDMGLILFRAERYVAENLALPQELMMDYHYMLVMKIAVVRFHSYNTPYRKKVRLLVRKNVTGQIRRDMIRHPWRSAKDKLTVLLLLYFPGVCNLARNVFHR